MINLIKPNTDALLEKWKHVMRETAHQWTWTSDLELSWLAEYATHCTRILEIGSYNGRSAKVMLLANPKLTLVSLDTWDDGNLPTYRHNLGPELAAGRVEFHQGESQKTIHEITGKFDGCFVDGGHLEHLVKADILNVTPLMKHGSLMAGHDFRPENGVDNDVARGVRSSFGDDFHVVADSIWVHQL
jgi:predicted O-methyltransferase YrrM